MGIEVAIILGVWGFASVVVYQIYQLAQ